MEASFAYFWYIHQESAPDVTLGACEAAHHLINSFLYEPIEDLSEQNLILSEHYLVLSEQFQFRQSNEHPAVR